ncbi:MAG: nucleotidyltransferase [Planctomycetaceae bacterium]|nr:nucleotidyltransferase [Planctomycetaceae bacterium]
MKDKFINLIDKLRDHNVEFVIIGGLASIIHGSTRTTQDIDICCKFSSENLRKLFGAIKDKHPVHRMNPKRPVLVLNDENIKKFKNLYIDTDIGQLDCLGEVQGIGQFDEVLKNAITINIDKKTYNVLSLDALIKSKKTLNRPQDKQDVLHLEAIKQAKKDERKK